MLQLGIVTYNIAKDWDLPTILTRLETPRATTASSSGRRMPTRSRPT